MSLLVAEGLTAGYSSLPVIREMTVRADAGQIVSIIGPNGSGKSTLLKAIIGLIKPTAGRVFLSGSDVTGWRADRIVRQGMAYVPQTRNVFVSLSVLENLEMGAFIRKGAHESQLARVMNAFPALAEAGSKKAGNLSVGQRNMLGLARALMCEPKVILVDEPTAGLAPDNVRLIWDQLHGIAETGVAVVVVEQNVEMALRSSEMCFLMIAGRNRLEGPSHVIGQRDLNQIFLGQDDEAVNQLRSHQ